MARIGIEIQAADYSIFKALMPTEERLGKSYADWMRRRFEEDTRPGEAVTHVTVRPREFRLYCLQVGQKPNYSVLEAFAEREAHQNKIGAASRPRQVELRKTPGSTG